MKKFFFLAAVAALAFVGCNKENQEPATPQPDLVYTGATQVVIQEGTNFYTVNFTANAKWEAKLEMGETMSIDKTSGSTGEQSIKVTFEDLGEGVTGCCGVLGVSTAGWEKQPDEGQYFIIVFIQGKVFIVSAMEEDTVGTEGGKIYYKIFTNCQYEVKKYDQFEAWAPATIDGDLLTFDVKANTGYDARQAYVKFTVNEIQVDVTDAEGKPTGETEALVARAYANQEGNAKLAWAKSISSATSSFPVGSLVRLCHNGDEVAITYDQYSQSFDKATGAVKSPGTGMSGITNFVSDAAGHLVFSNTATYQGESGADILSVWYIGDGMDQPKEIINYKHQDVYSFTLGNVRVYGDVSKDAVVCAMTDCYAYCVYWEINNGVVGAAQNFALPSVADWEAYTGIIWNAERGACVVPMGTTADQGFLYMGYDAQYKLFAVDKNGTSQSIFSFDDYMGTGAGSNVNFQCISVANFNGSLYALVGVSTYFNWGNCPDLMLFDIANAELVSYINHLNYEIPVNYLGANDGENAAADVLLLDEGDKMGAYMADLLNDVIYKVEFPKL